MSPSASTLRTLLSSASLGLYRVGRLARRPGTLRVLYYHSVSDAPIRSSVSPSAFTEQIEYLVRSGYCLMSLSQAVDHLADGSRMPDRTVVITLDDGFRDNYENALPVLARLGVPATIFLTAGYIDTDRLPTLTRTDFVPLPLTWDQVREMQRHGIEFGSHTVTHPMLAQAPPGAARREIAESKRIIERELGVPAPLFCYPRGDFNAAVKAMVREEGYRAACTTLPGSNGTGADLFALRRTYVSRFDTSSEFAKKVEGGYDLLHQVIHQWRRLRPR